MNSVSRRNLWIYSLTGAVSRFGDQFQFLAVTGLTYAITGSTFAAALQMSVKSLPYIILARLAGSWADRYDPRRLTLVATLLQALLTLAYLPTRSVTAILVLNFLVSCLGVFINAARTALLPQMVGRQQLLAANARLATVSGAAQLLAPALAGIIMVRIGIGWAFLINSLSFLFPAIGMLFIQAVEPMQPAPQGARSGLAPAWAFVCRDRGFLRVVLLYVVYNVGMWSVNALFYPYCADILQAGMDVMGVNISCYYGAFLITGVALERWGKALRHPRWLPLGFLVGALVWCGYTFTRRPAVTHLLSSFDGIVYTYTFTMMNTWIGERAPANLRGRVGALVRALEEVGTITGQLAGGAIAGFSGILSGMYWSSGATVLAVVATVAAFRRSGASSSEPAWPEEAAS